MADDNKEFELEVIERLTRLETKVDYANGTVKTLCTDVSVLKEENLISEVQWKTIKRGFATIGGVLGVISVVLGIVVIIMRMW
jgi:hypothetical protein